MTEQLPATTERSAPMRVTGRLKVALDAMVWHGLSRNDAAKSAGIKPHAVYCALRKPHVLGYYREQIGVLRTSELARNVHVLAEVRDSSENAMARVAAAKALEPPAAQAALSVNIAFQAGYVIDLSEPEDRLAPLTIEHETHP